MLVLMVCRSGLSIVFVMKRSDLFSLTKLLESGDSIAAESELYLLLSLLKLSPPDSFSSLTPFFRREVNFCSLSVIEFLISSIC
jgi:hypothetical protein